MKKKEPDSQKGKGETKSVMLKLEGLEKQLEDLRREKDDLFEKLQRVSADYANFQKRVPKQISDTISYEKENIIKSLLPAIDNFEHTLQNAASLESIEVLIEGIRIVYDQMIDILKSHNVTQIKAEGEKFDPAVHQAMMQRTDEQMEDNVVLECFQTGYKLNDRVLRPSRVIVNKLAGQDQDEAPPSDTEKKDAG